MQDWQEQRAWFDKEKEEVAPFFFDAHNVDAYRFIVSGEHKWHKPQGEVHGINYLASSTLQGAEFTARLGARVLDSRIYRRFGIGYSGCRFEPTFGYRIWLNEDFITIIFCLSCQELIILQNSLDVSERPSGSYVGRYNLAGHFNRDTQEEFAKLYYEVFPGIPRS
jgi:hypothetical protein